jgi:two-component system vancomycin resistance sensor histidine kinase VraS/NarL family two-component system sensor histidine kinase LiaS
LDIANAEFKKQHYDSKRLMSVTEMSKQAILTLRETVWALSNEAISIEAFSDKFKAYVQKMSEFSTDIAITIVDQIESNETLPPNVALHLFRICQEAFSNALKHAQASKINIVFSNSKTMFFQYKIHDNGIGFDLDEARKKGHYGLQNMQHRAAEIGANYTLRTSVQSGTEILISMQTKNTTYA